MKKRLISLSLCLLFPVVADAEEKIEHTLPSMNDYLNYSYQKSIDSINYTMLNEVAETFG